jgi:hypothetical protein
VVSYVHPYDSEMAILERDCGQIRGDAGGTAIHRSHKFWKSWRVLLKDTEQKSALEFTNREPNRA